MTRFTEERLVDRLGKAAKVAPPVKKSQGETLPTGKGGSIKSPKWTEADKETLRDYYQSTPFEFFSVADIAEKVGRSENAVIVKAGRLGFSDKARKGSTAARAKMRESQKRITNTPEARAKMSERAIRYIAQNGHPRGFQGGRHSDKAKQLISESAKRSWANPDNYLNSEEYRQSLSDRFSTLPSLKREKTYSRGNGGKRPDLDNRYFRSSWEANYARYLNWLVAHKQIDRWEYEPDTYWFETIKRGTRSYTPDFKVWAVGSGTPYYDEVKGWMDATSKTKLSRMSKYYPHIKVNVVGEAEYKQIAKSVGSLISGWESRR